MTIPWRICGWPLLGEPNWLRLCSKKLRGRYGMRERWGAFSVRDHVSDAPFVSEVLLYDRLIIPIPDPNDNLAEVSWAHEGWKPDVLRDCLDVLKVKTD